jgi:hypothetical protein
LVNEDLSGDERREVFLLQAQFGYTPEQARAYWERERRAQQPQPIEEDEEPIEPEESELDALRLDNQRRIRTLIDSFYDDEQEEEDAEESAKLPENIQAEYQKRVDESVKNINIQLEAQQRQVLENLEKYRIEAQKQIDEHLQFSLCTIDEYLTNSKPTDFVRQFIDILLAMEYEPLKNIEWQIILLREKDGTVMVKGNNTVEKDEKP